MRKTLALVALGAMAFATPALAQSTGPAPGAGTGAGAGGSGSGGVVTTDLDLPFDKPLYTAPTPPTPAPTPTPPLPPAPVPDDGGDDPADEPPPVIYGEEIDTESDTIVYVIDISCSMDWDNQSYTTLDGGRATGNRMIRAKTELSRSIVGLSRNFSFTVVAFDCGTRTWSPSLQPADDGNKASALAWVNGLQPTGATGTGPATALGLSLDRENSSVVLLTDGAPNCGVPEYDSGGWWYDERTVIEGHRRMIRSANTQAATINVFGIAASGDYRRFCVNVASDSGGSYFDVP
jgi:hypothetical protein